MTAPAVVIGTGVDELVCAHYLARHGHRVLLLEERPLPEEGPPDIGWIPPNIVRDFALERHGLAVRFPDPWVAAPLPGGGHLELWGDPARSAEAIRRLSPRDAARWPAFCERMARLARLLETLYRAAPPDPVGRGLGALMRLGALGLRLRRLGRNGMEDFLRLMPMSAADWLDDWFDSDALKGVLGAAAILHGHGGPRAGGTAFRLLHHHAGSPVGVFRPAQSNLRRVLASLPGIEIRRAAKVARIAVRQGNAAGVVLVNGEEINTDLVISGADPRRTLLELVEPGWLDPAFTRAARGLRCRGVASRLTLALGRAPRFPVFEVAPSLDYLERASDDAKYGQISQRPYLQARSGGQSADGHHRAYVHLQYAPHALADGQWNDARRAALGELGLRVLSQHAPDLDAAVESVLAPPDLEAVEGWPEGQAYHAELALDQLLWMRPLPDCAQYRTPISGLYLCGPGMHPGGGIAGAAGANAATAILNNGR